MTPRRILISRHGQTDANAQGRTIALSDPPLNLIGVGQATQLGLALAAEDLDLIVSSPRLRCRQTAEAVVRAQRGTPSIKWDERLVELGLGVFEGLSREEIRQRGFNDILVAWRQGIPPRYPEGAEHFEDAAARLSAAFDEIAGLDAGTVLILGHSHALRIMMMVSLFGGDPAAHRRLFLGHATITSVFFEGDVPRLESLNGVSAAGR